ncbi:hypothetical protein TSUD_338000 [Trifolium subterraneum]|uniref:Glycosyltransferase 2-like domain-containing protein n=1 Tax=Trifolium subterraneum TaxID=3900 RepID=A0A2Z6LT28_TRISU|nr:hypothetical protein TSUD_338000 [Trifolium subterraneum]
MKSLIFEEPEGGIPGYASSSLRYAWQSIRAPVIIPLLKLAVIICSIMSVMLFIERVGMAAVILVVKVLRKKKYTKYKLDAMKQNIERNKRYPMVLIQIPMYNEKEVYKLSIGAVCGLSWPTDRLVVQVLDDSTNQVLRRVSLLKRLHLIYAFFFVRKVVAHWVTFFFYCIVIPACVVVPEVHLKKQIAIYIPATITILNAISTPRIHPLEIIVGMYMLHCAIYDLLFGHDHFFIYLLLQAGAFFTMGFGIVGTIVPN